MTDQSSRDDADVVEYTIPDAELYRALYLQSQVAAARAQLEVAQMRLEAVEGDLGFFFEHQFAFDYPRDQYTFPKTFTLSETGPRVILLRKKG